MYEMTALIKGWLLRFSRRIAARLGPWRSVWCAERLETSRLLIASGSLLTQSQISHNSGQYE